MADHFIPSEWADALDPDGSIRAAFAALDEQAEPVAMPLLWEGDNA